jgi:hypothetical protein
MVSSNPLLRRSGWTFCLSAEAEIILRSPGQWRHLT